MVKPAGTGSKIIAVVPDRVCANNMGEPLGSIRKRNKELTVSYLQEGYYSDRVVAAAMPSERVTFIRRTYGHLAGAILAFAGLEALLITIPGIANTVVPLMFSSGLSWLVVLVAFAGVSWLATRWAESDASVGLQYLGLSLYVVAEAVIFLPLML